VKPRNRLILILALLAALPLVALASIYFGLPEQGREGVIQIRRASVLLAILAGAGLSLAGVVLQAILRNPLAEPYILGISAGGGLGAGAAIILGLTFMGMWTLPAAAFIGSVATILLVYKLGRVGGRTPVHTLLLSGVVVNAVLGSMLMFMISISTREGIHDVIWWLLGNLDVYDWNLLAFVAAVVIGAGIAVTLLARDLNVMVLGEEPATHLGLRVERMKVVFFVLASLMTGATVAACGLIGFVGLIVPHIMRAMMGPDHRTLLPASALAGAIFLILKYRKKAYWG